MRLGKLLKPTSSALVTVFLLDRGVEALEDDEPAAFLLATGLVILLTVPVAAFVDLVVAVVDLLVLVV